MMEKTLILKHISRMLCLLISYSKFTRTLRNNLLKCGKTYSMIKEKEGVVHDDTDEGTGS